MSPVSSTSASDGDRLVGDLAGRDHDPDRARLLELRCEVGQRLRTRGAVGLERLDRVREDVVADAAVAVLHEPPDDAGAHPAEPDHSELHGGICCHWLAPFSEDEAVDGVREAVLVVRRRHARARRDGLRARTGPSRSRARSGRTSARRWACRRWSRSPPARCRTWQTGSVTTRLCWRGDESRPGSSPVSVQRTGGRRTGLGSCLPPPLRHRSRR